MRYDQLFSPSLQKKIRGSFWLFRVCWLLGYERGEQKRKMEFWKIVLCWMCSFTFFFFSWGARHTPWVSKVCEVSGERGGRGEYSSRGNKRGGRGEGVGFFQNAMCRSMIGNSNLIISNRTVLKLSDVARSVSRWAAESGPGPGQRVLIHDQEPPRDRIATRRSTWHVILDKKKKKTLSVVTELAPYREIICICTASYVLLYFNADGMRCARSRGCGRDRWNGFRGGGGGTTCARGRRGKS